MSKKGDTTAPKQRLRTSWPELMGDNHVVDGKNTRGLGQLVATIREEAEVEAQKLGASLVQGCVSPGGKGNTKGAREAAAKSAIKPLIGFDMEWAPQLTKGGKQNKTALIQLCSGKTVAMVRLSNLPALFSESTTPEEARKAFPGPLRKLLEDDHILKSGIGIKNDATKLSKDFNVTVNGLLDPSIVIKGLFPQDLQPKSYSLKSLAQEILAKDMNAKTKTQTMSDWANPSGELTTLQIQYAADDVRASFWLGVEAIQQGWLHFKGGEKKKVPLSLLTQDFCALKMPEFEKTIVQSQVRKSQINGFVQVLQRSLTEPEILALAEILSSKN